MTHDFGETVSALKEHVRQVEFHIRYNYIRKDDFIVHMKSHDELLSLNFEEHQIPPSIASRSGWTALRPKRNGPAAQSTSGTVAGG